MNASTLILGSSTRVVEGELVAIEYAYVAKRATIFDEELIAWANRIKGAHAPKKAAPGGGSQPVDSEHVKSAAAVSSSQADQIPAVPVAAPRTDELRLFP